MKMTKFSSMKHIILKNISNFAFMKLIADSGSTKTDWVITDNEEHTVKLHTQGINPFHQSAEDIDHIISTELIPQLEGLSPTPSSTRTELSPTPHFTCIEFYGAGCNAEKAPILASALQRAFPHCNDIIVGSDMLGAAKALCGNREGIACILGTGANSCLYDGERIVKNVSPMGYILGDEGSGAVIGRTFITELYKGEHTDFIPVFENATGLTAPIIINKVYREAMPNRFLASLCVFINEHKDREPWIGQLVIDCMRLFFRRNISHYNRPGLPVNFVGSIAYHFHDELQKAATLEGYTVGKIMKAPLYSS